MTKTTQKEGQFPDGWIQKMKKIFKGLGLIVVYFILPLVIIGVCLWAIGPSDHEDVFTSQDYEKIRIVLMKANLPAIPKEAKLGLTNIVGSCSFKERYLGFSAEPETIAKWVYECSSIRTAVVRNDGSGIRYTIKPSGVYKTASIHVNYANTNISIYLRP